MIVLDYSPKNKRNIHKSTMITINDGIDKQMEKKSQVFLMKFQKLYADIFTSKRGSLICPL